MNIKKADLLEVLEIVKPGLANKDLMEQTTSFAFINGFVMTYNDEISLSHPIEGLEIEGAVEAEFLYKLLNKVKKKEIEITQEKNELKISAGRMDSGLTFHQEIKLPMEDVGGSKDWQPIPKKLVKHMKFAAGACSRDMSRPVMTFVHVNKKGFVEGSDTYRIVNCSLEEELPVNTFLIPSGSIMHIVRIDPVEIAESSGWIHFRNDAGTVLSCRITADKYPDTSRFLEVEGEKIKFPRTISDLLERAGIFAKRDFMTDESVTISMGDKRMTISSESESGWFKEEVNLNYDGDEIEFNITPYLLKDILAETRECTYGKNVLFFENEDWRYLTMLRKK